MRFTIAAGLTLGLAPSVLSSAIPVAPNTSPALDKRVVPVTPPQGSVTCLGYTVPEADILSAINQGLGWATTNPPTQMGKTDLRSSSFHSTPSSYHFDPHPFTKSEECTKLTQNLAPRLIQLPPHLQQLREPHLRQLRRFDTVGVPCAPLRQQPVGTSQEHQVTPGPQW